MIALAEFALTKAHVVVPYSEALAELAIDVAGARGSLDELRRRFNELVAVIQDRKTGETISQIPSKDILKLRGQIDDLVGMVINRKV